MDQALSSSMVLSSFMFKPADIHPDRWGAKACHAKRPSISLTRLESCMWQLRLVKSLLVLSASEEASYQRLAASSLLPKPLSHMLRTPRGFGGYGWDVRCVLSCKVSTGPTRSFGCRKKKTERVDSACFASFGICQPVWNSKSDTSANFNFTKVYFAAFFCLTVKIFQMYFLL